MGSPRKSRKKSLCFSSTMTSTPARARRNPSMTPAGPPPTMQQVQCSLFAPPADGAIESIRKFRVQAGQVKFPDGNRMRLNGVRLEDGGDAVDSYFIQTSWLIRGRLM